MMTTFTWLPDAAWRGALLLAIAFVFARLLKPQPAAIRHVLWTVALAGVMAMPILSIIAPVRLPVAVPPRVLAMATPAPDVDPAGSVNPTTVSRRARDGTSISSQQAPEPDRAPDVSAVGPTWFQRLSLVQWAVIAWTLGLLLLSARLVAGFVALGRMRRSGRPPADRTVVDLAEATVASALNRTESRGAHSREDFPKRNDAEWLKHTLIYKKEDGTLSFRYKPVMITRFPPKERTY